MQTLGLSDSTPRSEGRLKSLFWPSITSGSDVDYLGRQGFWVCTVVGILSFLFLALVNPLLGLAILLVYFLGGVGVRERSRYAATIVFALYFLETLVLLPGLLSPGGILRIVCLGLLLSNFRATWIASRWQPGSEDAELPIRLSDTWGDKLTDQLPMWLWPKISIPYYIFASGFLVLEAYGLLNLFTRIASS